MELLNRIAKFAIEKRDQIAFINSYSGQTITYGQLHEYSGIIAAYLSSLSLAAKSPIVVYGHKNPLMLALFIGCVKAGHPYCPVDISMPEERLQDIINASEAELMFALDHTSVFVPKIVSCHEVKKIIYETDTSEVRGENYVTQDEVFYIIFTSGSTGKPKGVQIAANCLDNFLAWMEGLEEKYLGYSGNNTFLNQAPYSFDLSVMDVYTSLYCGETIWALDKRTQENMIQMYQSFGKSNITIWVSTPSFVNMCMINKNFSAKLLPKLRIFFFCGEVLTHQTVEKLYKRFPEVKIINTYGPTESTVCVTETLITDEMVKKPVPLPMGHEKPGTSILIMDSSYSYPGYSWGG